MENPLLISLHGGHSGEFCSHARDGLENIILRYMDLGFTRVGITEHVPPSHADFLYPDEKNLGLTVVYVTIFIKYAHSKWYRVIKNDYQSFVKLYGFLFHF